MPDKGHEMSDTPRTDAAEFSYNSDNPMFDWVVDADFARELERELDEYERTEPLKRAELSNLRSELTAMTAAKNKALKEKRPC